MHIGPYTFEEFKERAAAFHGYPAPGLLLGGYMVAMAQRALPADCLFEAVVETKKCLPDAVQLLTLCSTGNNWMKVVNLGKYAVSLFDKRSGEGFRVHVAMGKLEAFPEIRAWLLKQKAKKDQDTAKLFHEIESAGDSICAMTPMRVRAAFLGHAPMGDVGICPQCGEAYPSDDGFLCRGCQGEAPYADVPKNADRHFPQLRVVPVAEAVGEKALHDMTEIIPGVFKGAAFTAGQVLSASDVCRLQQMGRFHVAVQDVRVTPDAAVHENEGVEAFARRMAGEHVTFSLPPKEGKINLRSTIRGLLCVDAKRLEAFNMLPDVICASRQDGTLLEESAEFAGTRVIPLYVHEDAFAAALQVLDRPLFSVAPLRSAKAAILVTGTEVFKGLIEDRFVPIISAKLWNYGCNVIRAEVAPDDKSYITRTIEGMRDAGADLLVTTGGLSVDPDDVTRAALLDAGLVDVLYGAPVLPGTMSLIGRIANKDRAPLPEASSRGQVCGIRQPEAGEMQVIGVPACALYHKVTLFDILLPRLLAGRQISRAELAALGEGGFCANCKLCTWPKCFFAK
ncbi:MAG: FmdE family protein [Deltaproteobacteria bacterium]|jgi:formylmethanofuran dehydrogenase subunit E|nr:FmdE family protein [Deltaproteobacteria bacterium]